MRYYRFDDGKVVDIEFENNEIMRASHERQVRLDKQSEKPGDEKKRSEKEIKDLADKKKLEIKKIIDELKQQDQFDAKQSLPSLRKVENK